MKTVVGLLENKDEAQDVLLDLVNRGFPRDAIEIKANDEVIDEDINRFVGEGGETKPAQGIFEGTQTRMGEDLIELGIPESDARWYAEAVRRGGVLVTVFADDDRAEEAAEVMRLYGAIDIDEQAQSWSQEGASFNERQARSTELEAENLGEPYRQRENISAMDDEEFLRHFKATYGQRGEHFEETYRSAYHFAEAESSSHPQFLNMDWPEVEEDLHQDWERSHPGTWVKVEEAIHFGWNRTRRH